VLVKSKNKVNKVIEYFTNYLLIGIKSLDCQDFIKVYKIY